jgi:hypothetical protein
MKILAIEHEKPGLQALDFQNYLIEEAQQLWQLYLAGEVREIYFRTDTHEAVIILECPGPAEARSILDALPLVRARLISFEIIPLGPYDGFARLFT